MLRDCAGDQTGHLLWRLQNGETPDSEHQPAAAVILIGTNDLGVAMRPAKRGGLDLTDPTPCAVGTAVRCAAQPRPGQKPGRLDTQARCLQPVA